MNTQQWSGEVVPGGSTSLSNGKRSDLLVWFTDSQETIERLEAMTAHEDT